MTRWTNWSGSVSATPARVFEPADEASLSACVRESSKVRVAGSGHSFMPLCETPGTLVSLRAMQGTVRVAPDRQTVFAPAGMSLAKLTEVLWSEGLSMLNQGDVNPQALAGALATGTHGTGITLGSLSTTLVSARVMLADGNVVRCSRSERSELFEAQRLSLGLSGIMIEAEIAVAPAYWLEEKVRTMPLDEAEAFWPDLIASNRHAEFWIFPYVGRHGPLAIVKTLSIAEPGEDTSSAKDMDDAAFQKVCELCAMFPFLTRFVQPRLVGPGLASRRLGPAWKVFPSERSVRFEEMEYEVPLDAGFGALREAMAHIVRHRLPVAFPFEFRVVAGDDIWISPLNGGPRASISMHQFHAMPWRKAFADVEAIWRGHGGRPHWAKRHTLGPGDIDVLYPQAARFRAAVKAADPEGKFANAHLAALFGLQATPAAA